MIVRHVIRYATVTGLCLVAIACSGGSDGPAPTTVAPANTAEVVLDDYRFAPTVLAAGDAEIVRVKNLGGLEHSWSVLAEPIESEFELAEATVLAEARVQVGQSADVDISRLEPGRYEVVCVIPGHISAGMVGELVIDEA